MCLTSAWLICEPFIFELERILLLISQECDTPHVELLFTLNSLTALSRGFSLLVLSHDLFKAQAHSLKS